jgi:hypothetical protein
MLVRPRHSILPFQSQSWKNSGHRRRCRTLEPKDATSSTAIRERDRCMESPGHSRRKLSREICRRLRRRLVSRKRRDLGKAPEQLNRLTTRHTPPSAGRHHKRFERRFGEMRPSHALVLCLCETALVVLASLDEPHRVTCPNEWDRLRRMAGLCNRAWCAKWLIEMRAQVAVYHDGHRRLVILGLRSVNTCSKGWKASSRLSLFPPFSPVKSRPGSPSPPGHARR